MRAFLIFLAIVALVVIGLVALGIVRISGSDEELNIRVDRKTIEQGVDRAVEGTGQALENAGEKIQEQAEPAPSGH